MTDLLRLLAIAIIYCAASGSLYSQSNLKARSQLLGSQSPFSFPERIVVGPQGEVYILDTDLSTLFTLETRTGKLDRVCGPEKLSSPSDLAVDLKGNFWVLSALRSKIFKLTQQCEVQIEITSKPLPLRVATNTFGEVIVLKGAGHNLFELYRPDGKFVRGFGERIDYKDETTNAELSDGRITPDSSGGFFFSFNYPPLIRHYGRRGNLIDEFRPPSDVNIAPPNVSVRRVGNSMAVKSTYQILVLDMAFDGKGRLYLLMSGQHKVPALLEGTGKLALFTSNGRLLKTADLENNFHALAVSSGSLFLLRNRKPFRVDTYSFSK